MEAPASAQISGTTAAEIAGSVRSLVERGELGAADLLPPVRALAERLGVNRNTAVAAYRRLARDGVVVGQGRAGTRVAGTPDVPQEGFAAASTLAGLSADVPAGTLRDLGTGNPAPALIPDPAPVLPGVVGRPVLYGEPVIDPGFEAWARGWMAPDVPGGTRAADGPGSADAGGDGGAEIALTLTSGAVDAIERLLTQALTRDDAVALEDPCFLASIQTVRHAGYRAHPVPVDDEGMTPDGLRAALEAGARAVVLTPRAQNPTGASLTEQRAEELRQVLAEHPYVLVIQDDYYSMLSRSPFRSVVPAEHRRWALIRSVSKFLGPDLCLAVTATDPETARRLALRLSPGTTWVSHLLQRLAHGMLRAEGTREIIERAGDHYAERSAEAARRFTAQGVPVTPGDGMSLWVPVPRPAAQVAADLARSGWLVRTGDEFRLVPDEPGAAAEDHLRITVHDLDDAELDALAADLAAACR
ncbi:aminotransferase class I/II-fold pyridoxal phosphate-dependent enzyme [Brachybacterium aquaticum]|uniref:DNA-binding transcriptional MocR family regulator n=1 Tax=Brachybacterium aquaticum TaxID=1432564 RepID=A0A841AIS7_9MICO|nr:aminotransferase class I/II-fold pyridoxal phosphate-dependent enzyme [Brachybacterium aquaticum]MBB5832938.1 DNA-binding transcriptional MocR family regulator [Brachybacterium aquaticum]